MIQITGGTLMRRKLKWPKKDSIRPTPTKVREALFQVLGNELEDAVFWDLCAGSGIMGFEALSRGAKQVYFVEKQGSALKCIQDNIATFQCEEQAQIGGRFVLDFIQRYKGPKVDIIYCDPPYESPIYEPVFEAIDQGLVRFGSGRALVIFEHRKSRELPQDTPALKIYQKREYGDVHLSLYEEKNDV